MCSARLGKSCRRPPAGVTELLQPGLKPFPELAQLTQPARLMRLARPTLKLRRPLGQNRLAGLTIKLGLALGRGRLACLTIDLVRALGLGRLAYLATKLVREPGPGRLAQLALKLERELEWLSWWLTIKLGSARGQERARQKKPAGGRA
jgi:hypothetical protein